MAPVDAEEYGSGSTGSGSSDSSGSHGSISLFELPYTEAIGSWEFWGMFCLMVRAPVSIRAPAGWAAPLCSRPSPTAAAVP